MTLNPVSHPCALHPGALSNTRTRCVKKANWGQSLNYDYEIAQDPYYTNPTSFQEIASAMAGLVEEVTLMGAPVLLDPSKLRHSICDDNRKKCCWILGLEVFRSNRDANCPRGR